MNNIELVWFAAKTRANQELAIKKYLDKVEVENYLPIKREVKIYGSRRRMVEKPLISNLVFIRTCRKMAYSLLNEHGVKMTYMIDYLTRKALIIPEKQMADFIYVMSLQNQDDICITDSVFAKGDKVRIINGDFCGVEGELIRVEGKTYVLLQLQGIISLTVKVSKDDVEKIKKYPLGNTIKSQVSLKREL